MDKSYLYTAPTLTDASDIPYKITEADPFYYYFYKISQVMLLNY
jgi:hypothetical protein